MYNFPFQFSTTNNNADCKHSVCRSITTPACISVAVNTSAHGAMRFRRVRHIRAGQIVHSDRFIVVTRGKIIMEYEVHSDKFSCLHLVYSSVYSILYQFNRVRVPQGKYSVSWTLKVCELVESNVLQVKKRPVSRDMLIC